MKCLRLAATVGFGACLAMSTLAAPANARGVRDSDHDGMSNRFEIAHRLHPFDASDRLNDPDHDGLTNLGEFRNGGKPRDEDTDNDGSDDSDEIRDHTKMRDSDSDNDEVRDGDEDADDDDITNEDEDDSREPCRGDDDDTDDDGVANEDENELGTSPRDADSDNNGISDGSEDANSDGELNEDEDDHGRDRCKPDRDSDGHHDEDEDDTSVGHRAGTVVSFDAETGVLVLVRDAEEHTFMVTEETRIRVGDEEGTVADLTPDAIVTEIRVVDDTNELRRIELKGLVDSHDGDDGDDDHEDEHEGGTIVSFDTETSTLVLTNGEHEHSFTVTEETEIRVGDAAGTTADLVAGAQVEDVRLFDGTSTVRRIQLETPEDSDGEDS